MGAPIAITRLDKSARELRVRIWQVTKRPGVATPFGFSNGS